LIEMIQWISHSGHFHPLTPGHEGRVHLRAKLTRFYYFKILDTKIFPIIKPNLKLTMSACARVGGVGTFAVLSVVTDYTSSGRASH
jgi:hypothetical protein